MSDGEAAGQRCNVRIERVGSLGKLMLADGSGPATFGELRLSQLAEAFGVLQRDDSVRTICLCGRPGKFLLGADVPFFVRCLVSRDMSRILDFTQRWHALLREITESQKPVVCWVTGPAYGAGLEIALACHQILASPTARFALPETSLGIYPGMGGTQRTPRRIGPGLAKWMIFTGTTVPASQALGIGLVDAVCDESQFVARSGAAVVNRRLNLEPRWRLLRDFFDANRVKRLFDPGLKHQSLDTSVARALLRVRQNAPIAMQLAEAVMDEGAQLDLPAAIEREFSRLPEVLASEDALTGLLTFGRSRATFAGR